MFAGILLLILSVLLLISGGTIWWLLKELTDIRTELKGIKLEKEILYHLRIQDETDHHMDLKTLENSYLQQLRDAYNNLQMVIEHYEKAASAQSESKVLSL